MISSPFGDCVVTAGRNQRASFVSFRVVIIRLWATVLGADNIVFLRNQAYDFIY